MLFLLSSSMSESESKVEELYTLWHLAKSWKATWNFSTVASACGTSVAMLARAASTTAEQRI